MPEVSDPTHIGTGACADAPVFRHLAPDVHIAGIDGHVVVLKLSQDRYFNLSHQHSQGLRRLIGWRSDGDIPVDVLLATQAMFDAQGILAPGAHATPDPRIAKRDMSPRLGFDAWLAMPADVARESRVRDVMRAGYWLWQAQRVTRRARMRGVVDMVVRSQSGVRTQYGAPQDYLPYVAAMHSAALVYPQCSPCLPWYAALTAWCARDGLRLRLVIGVQRQPFYAHAWAESDARVIGDDLRRREQLAVIYETPV
ncbi:lasso peptide biosynthesis B2 protein [Pandoraea sp. PE-S2T-3]|uniref:lasso peptide biosynthesis B2 protein n=1 Tax=Pandoraea sp. PE-S2T-3 TaxID=1986993 RepID=UPI000B3F7D2A|nr:lasso peptide biosynthesis B2 protein [Pandoraea sp. PE-S2T-3]